MRPIYAFSTDEIRRRVEDSHETVISQVRTIQRASSGTTSRTRTILVEPAWLRCAASWKTSRKGKAEGRYVTASLPSLPFENGQFDLALCSHLLFLYSAQLSLDFHRASIEELLRVASEVRAVPPSELGSETVTAPRSPGDLPG